MHIDFNMTSILFRGVLFCCFVYKVHQIFIKKKLRDYLDGELQNLRNEQVELVEKETLLLSTRKRLEGQLQTQRQLFIGIEKKYAQFVAIEREHAAVKNAAFVARMMAIKQKQEMQQKNWHDIAALRAVIPGVVSNVRAELVQHYDKARREQVLKNFLKTLA